MTLQLMPTLTPDVVPALQPMSFQLSASLRSHAVAEKTCTQGKKRTTKLRKKKKKKKLRRALRAN